MRDDNDVWKYVKQWQEKRHCPNERQGDEESIGRMMSDDDDDDFKLSDNLSADQRIMMRKMKRLINHKHKKMMKKIDGGDKNDEKTPLSTVQV